MQVVGFVILISGTSIYNEIMRSCLPSMEPEHKHRRHHQHHHDRHRTGVQQAAGGSDGEVGSLQQPLLLDALENGGGRGNHDAGTSGGRGSGGGKGPGSGSSTASVSIPVGEGAVAHGRPPLPSRPRAAPRADYSMAR